MKTNWLLLFKFILFSRYKKGLQDHRTDSFIAGIYEREYKYGDSQARDVLTIRRLSQVTDLFQVERRVVRGPVAEGEVTEQLCRTEKWIAAYHITTRQLVQGVSHKIFSFAPERALLLFENKEYRKTVSLAFDLAIQS